MEINTQYILTPKTCRYASYGTLSQQTKYFWFCLHGSKMLCDQMLYKFNEFDPATHYVVAPEGMNRLYANGFGGDVVATWMTKRDRQKEINDFSTYLSALYKQEVHKLPDGCKKILLGFSQGGTSMYRWMHRETVEADFLIGYSCWIPEDIDLKESKTALNSIHSIYTYGQQDQFLSADRISALRNIIVKNELDISILPYDGVHKIDKGWLKEIWTSKIKKNYSPD